MSRYKFYLHPKTKDYVEWAVEHYHEDKRQLTEYKNDLIPSTTQSYSLAGGVQTGSPGNPTEKTGLKLASNPYIITTEKNIRAIEYVLNKCDEIDLKLIDLIYWKNKYTVTGAGIYLGLSKSGAYDRIGRILYLVALETGYENPVKEDAKV